MKRTQLYLEEAIWNGLQAKALSEKTTISELVRQAVKAQYFRASENRAEAMRAFVGIRQADPATADSVAEVRRLRKGTRLSRLASLATSL
jgi:predicted DNA-binding ribbon-helix-helix protein